MDARVLACSCSDVVGAIICHHRRNNSSPANRQLEWRVAGLRRVFSSASGSALMALTCHLSQRTPGAAESRPAITPAFCRAAAFRKCDTDSVLALDEFNPKPPPLGSKVSVASTPEPHLPGPGTNLPIDCSIYTFFQQSDG